MLNRILAAALAGGIAFLICVFIGGLLVVTGIPLVVYIGEFLVKWATAIAILAALAGFIGWVRFPFIRTTV